MSDELGYIVTSFDNGYDSVKSDIERLRLTLDELNILAALIQKYLKQNRPSLKGSDAGNFRNGMSNLRTELSDQISQLSAVKPVVEDVVQLSEKLEAEHETLEKVYTELVRNKGYDWLPSVVE